MRTPRIPLAALMVLTALAAVPLFLNPQTTAAHGTSEPDQGSAPVTIVSPLPLPVSDVNRPAMTPVQYNFVPAGFDPYVVPADKRLVIEYVSGSCTVEGSGRISAAYLTTSVATQKTPHSFYPVLTASTADNSNILVLSHPTRLYADPATEVFATVSIIGGAGSCSSLAFTGYLTNP